MERPLDIDMFPTRGRKEPSNRALQLRDKNFVKSMFSREDLIKDIQDKIRPLVHLSEPETLCVLEDEEDLLSLVTRRRAENYLHPLGPASTFQTAVQTNKDLEKALLSLAQPCLFDPSAWSSVYEKEDAEEQKESGPAVERSGEATDDQTKPTMQHYVRVWRVPKELFLDILRVWAGLSPVDFLTIESLRSTATGASTASHLSFLYAGQTIATTAGKRLADDHSAMQTKLSHFLKAIDEVNKDEKRVVGSSWVIRPLEFHLEDNQGTITTAEDLYQLNAHLWEVEECLIALGKSGIWNNLQSLYSSMLPAAVSRANGLNSAFGGSFCPRILSPDLQLLLDAFQAEDRSGSIVGLNPLPEEKIAALKAHYK